MIGKTTFRLETGYLDLKQDFQIRNPIFRLETQFLGLGTGFLDWKRNFQIGKKIFRLEKEFVD